MKHALLIFVYTVIFVLMLVGCAPQAEMSVSGLNTPYPEASASGGLTLQPTAEATDPLFDAELEDAAREMLDGMSLEQRVGQLFIARCPAEGALEAISEYHLGGFVLFARDFEDQTPQSMADIISGYQSKADIPMLIAVDEEGGIVTRVSRFPAFRAEPFASPRELYESGGLQGVLEQEREKCDLLKGLGINMNLAPVCDITDDPEGFMFERSLGQSPKITGDYVAAVVALQHSMGIGGALKHFPGYGNNADTHVGIARDEKSLAELESGDLVPFASGIRAGCDVIMVSHVYIDALDKEAPATLSPAVHNYLTKSMGFDGVIMTDDLVMQAITDIYGVNEAAVLAVLAGNHLLCVTDYAEQYQAVLEAVKSQRIPAEVVDRAALKVLKLKLRRGIIK